eukprot:SAG22_NODE_10_length_35702_cov_72.266992_4_plen_434_part_00
MYRCIHIVNHYWVPCIRPQAQGQGLRRAVCDGDHTVMAESAAKKPKTAAAGGGLATTQRQLNARQPGTSCTVLGFGGAHLGELYHTIPDSTAIATVEAAWDTGCRYFDTAPWYGIGLSEHRLGLPLSKHYRQRGEFLLSTKVGRLLNPVASCGGGGWTTEPWAGGMPFDVEYSYSRGGFARSLHDSNQRLGCGKVDCLVIHDLDEEFGFWAADTPDEKQPGALGVHAAALGRGGGMRWLEEQRASGVIKAFGAGVNSAEGRDEAGSTASNLAYVKRLLGMAADTANPLDFLLLAGNHSLLNHSAYTSGILDLCAEHDVGVVLGGAYNSGILATGAVEGAKYDYDAAPDEILDKVRQIERVCADCGNVPLAAAALQFPLAHPAVKSVIAGAMEPAHVHRTVDTMNTPVPSRLWRELKDAGLLPEGCPAGLPTDL